MHRIILVAPFAALATVAFPQSDRALSFWFAKYLAIEKDFIQKDSKAVKARPAAHYMTCEPTVTDPWNLPRWPTPEPPESASILWHSVKVRSVRVNGKSAKVQFVSGYRYKYVPELPESERLWTVPVEGRVTVHSAGIDTWRKVGGKWLLARTDYAEHSRHVGSWIKDAVLAAGRDYLAEPSKAAPRTRR